MMKPRHDFSVLLAAVISFSTISVRPPLAEGAEDRLQNFTNWLYSADLESQVKAFTEFSLDFINTPGLAKRLLEIAQTNRTLIAGTNAFRELALARLSDMGSLATNALPVLEKDLADSSQPMHIRTARLWEIFQISPGSETARRCLVKIFEGSTSELYRAAVDKLHNGPSYPAATNFIPVIAKRLAEEPEVEHREIIVALSVIGAQSPLAVQALRTALESRVPANRAEAMLGLVQMHAASPKDVLEFGVSLSDKDAEVRYSAAKALSLLAVTNAFPAMDDLKRAASSDDKTVAELAKQTIRYLEAESK